MIKVLLYLVWAVWSITCLHMYTLCWKRLLVFDTILNIGQNAWSLSVSHTSSQTVLDHNFLLNNCLHSFGHLQFVLKTPYVCPTQGNLNASKLTTFKYRHTFGKSNLEFQPGYGCCVEENNCIFCRWTVRCYFAADVPSEVAPLDKLRCNALARFQKLHNALQLAKYHYCQKLIIDTHRMDDGLVVHWMRWFQNIPQQLKMPRNVLDSNTVFPPEPIPHSF